MGVYLVLLTNGTSSKEIVYEMWTVQATKNVFPERLWCENIPHDQGQGSYAVSVLGCDEILAGYTCIL